MTAAHAEPYSLFILIAPASSDPVEFARRNVGAFIATALVGFICAVSNRAAHHAWFAAIGRSLAYCLRGKPLSLILVHAALARTLLGVVAFQSAIGGLAYLFANHGAIHARFFSEILRAGVGLGICFAVLNTFCDLHGLAVFAKPAIDAKGTILVLRRFWRTGTKKLVEHTLPHVLSYFGRVHVVEDDREYKRPEGAWLKPLNDGIVTDNPWSEGLLEADYGELFIHSVIRNTQGRRHCPVVASSVGAPWKKSTCDSSPGTVCITPAARRRRVIFLT